MEANEAVYFLDGCHSTDRTVNAGASTDVYVDASDTIDTQSTKSLIQQIINQSLT